MRLVDEKVARSAASGRTPGQRRIIFVGASTGGTDALKRFLLDMPKDCPPVLIVQHIDRKSVV